MGNDDLDVAIGTDTDVLGAGTGVPGLPGRTFDASPSTEPQLDDLGKRRDMPGRASVTLGKVPGSHEAVSVVERYRAFDSCGHESISFSRPLFGGLGIEKNI